MAQRTTPAAVFFGGLAIFAGSAAIPAVAQDKGVTWGILGAALLLGIWGVVLFARGGPVSFTPWLRRNHYLQAIVQIGLFVYWAAFWPRVLEQLPLIAVQLLFAYLLDMLISWTRWGEWRAGFGVVPPVLSVNLFLWFTDELFALQLLMVSLAFLSKGFLNWKRDGVERHIFNPSAFALTVMAVGLILTGSSGETHGQLISVALGIPPYMYVALAALSLIVLSTHPVVLITLSSALTVWLLGGLYYAIAGTWLFVDTAIPIAVFLGMLLLVTDPSTTPKSDAGRLLTGVIYGLAVVGFYIWFRAIDVPAFYDKLLIVPVLNLMVPWMDRLAERWRLDRLWEQHPQKRRMAVHLGVWVVAFCVMVPRLEAHPGKDTNLWSVACAEKRPFACENLAGLYQGLCERGAGEACFNLGLMHGGEGLPPDPGAALGNWSRACDLGFGPGCSRLGEAFARGEGVEKSLPRAAGLFEKACAAKDLESCRWVAGRVMAGQMEASAGLAPLKQLCDADDLAACANLGLLLLRGKAAPVDRPRAIALHRKACEGGLAEACKRLKALEGGAQPR